MDLQVAINDILLNCDSASDSIKLLFSLRKSANPRLSLAGLAKRSGIGSKGYLSEVMNGKKVLNPQFAGRLATAFGLTSNQSKCFQSLVKLAKAQHRGNSSEIKASQESLDAVRKLLKVASVSIPEVLFANLFAMRIYASFGLFQGNPTEQDFIDLMGVAHATSVTTTIYQLLNCGLIEAVDGGYRLKNAEVKMDVNPTVLSKYFRNCLKDAVDAIPKWLPVPKLAYFESSTISVKTSEYLNFLGEFRVLCEQFQSKLESSNAEQLIQFNVQIYPITLQS